MKDIAIELKNITKEYVIRHEKPTLVEKFIKGKTERFKALDNVSLTIRKGERVGIIGPNGSGKTTLLKIIAGIANPSSGSVKKYGRTVSIIDLGAGFHGDLTGYQNIFINGLLLGMSKKVIQNKLTEIINFAEIGSFIDAPLFTYSSGMCLRLGFAIAYFSDPDIFIIDEGISVGDQQFQKKTKKALDDLEINNKTVILTSHVHEIISLCNKLYMVKGGQIKPYNLLKK
jgi:ABC-2 type transport system ATP-binding protein/lipopolysaccharide transport system ATP-binding protein